ncbi:hypothetical protein SMICM304S_02843 [Streptomyces microflavus]
MTWWSDGGGKVTAARRPIEGREKVVRFLVGAFQGFAAGMTFTVAEINGAPGLLAWVATPWRVRSRSSAATARSRTCGPC